MNNIIIYLLLIFFGLAPSAIWLFFYLAKDNNPESKRMILKIFIYGMLSALPVVFIEIGFSDIFTELTKSSMILFAIFNIFIGISFVEELFKYLVVKDKVLSDPEFDEPVDLIIYMIIAGLGFAASENIFEMFYKNQNFQIAQVLTNAISRFITSTFLHALASGILGYFLALSFLNKKQWKLSIIGFLFVTIMHGIYDLPILPAIMKNAYWWLAPALVLIILALFLSAGFEKVKKMSSICIHEPPKK